MRLKQSRRGIGWPDALVVVGTIVVVGALLLPTTATIRKQATSASCGANERRLVWAALLYSSDWKGQLPTRVNSSEHVGTGGATLSLQGLFRLPIVGFDTSTIWDWQTYYCAPFEERYGQRIRWLGGLGFMMRDYLKNDFSTYVCPDGLFTVDDLLQKWDGTISDEGPIRLAGTASGFAFDGPGLFSYKVGYLWLPHRNESVGSAGECAVGAGSIPTTDQMSDVARTSTDVPEVLVTADMNYFGDRHYAVEGCPAKGGCGMMANHMPVRLEPRRLWEAACLVEIFPPQVVSDQNRDKMPTGMNQARLDGRVAWLPWEKWDYFRWAYHAMAGWHSF